MKYKKGLKQQKYLGRKNTQQSKRQLQNGKIFTNRMFDKELIQNIQRPPITQQQQNKQLNLTIGKELE